MDLQGRTPWQTFQLLGAEPHGLGHYLQAELISLIKAVEILKGLGPSGIPLHELMSQSIEFANGFPGIGAKFREVLPWLMSLAKQGVIAFDGDPEDWDVTTVRITAKGYLARPEEWYKGETKEAERWDVAFEPRF